MGYPHFSGDCSDYHARVVDWGGRAPAGVVTLCGSTRFMEEFVEATRALTLAGFVVISVGLFGHREGLAIGTADEPTEVKVALDELHKRKIDLADWILVIDRDGYVGISTAGEMDYAKQHGKRVSRLSHRTQDALLKSLLKHYRSPAVNS